MVRHFQVRLEEDEHRRFGKLADEKGLSMQALGREAVLEALKVAEESKIASPFGEITKTEERLLRAVLRYWREGSDADMLHQMLPLLVKQWGPRKP